ncbi:RNA polymerase sigma-70 factor [candidate division KSB1 bacterium]|nr:MAG: RNA polymerase sigma-70 factor [candidate division KSB1 bacterium]MCE7941770.1 RNA polymerase sigma-70 factor [Chlorobi bacterium CHB1]MDL1878604.1 RNA polymerase sigma-70 factor [Cytophagia bacterium CHB2]
MPKPKLELSSEQLAALQAGDTAVFKQLFEEFQPRLYRFLWLKLRMVEQEEDLVQETFLRFWNARSQLRPGGNIEIYLFRIASNLATDVLRRPKRENNRLELETQSHPAALAADQAIESEQLADMISEFVTAMPEGPRTAFILSRYENLSHAEIAEIMGISVKTVEKHIGKALRLLREKLVELGVRV